MNQFVPLLVAFTLAEMMFAMGLRLNFTELYDHAAANPRTIFRAFAANYLFVPLLTVAVIRFLPVDGPLAVSFLVLAVCPAAPYGPPFTIFAKGNLTLSVALMVLLAGSSAILAPLLLYFLLPLAAGHGAAFRIDASRLAVTLFLIQLMPLFLGLAVRQWLPVIARQLAQPAATASKILNFLMVVSLLALSYRSMNPGNTGGFAAMAWIFALSLLAGWGMGLGNAADRKTLGIVTSLRNMSLAVVIAAGTVNGAQVLTGVIAYAVLAGTGLLAVAAWWRYRAGWTV
jgi:BASS family bile acid:Na+ symporter